VAYAGRSVNGADASPEVIVLSRAGSPVPPATAVKTAEAHDLTVNRESESGAIEAELRLISIRRKVFDG
jgi:hypothetical protein